MNSGPATSPGSRPIVLSEERWAHVLARHPELGACRAEVLAVLANPAQRVAGSHPNEEWLYGPGGPSRWLKVVVHWDQDSGSVVTAFARRSLP